VPQEQLFNSSENGAIAAARGRGVQLIDLGTSATSFERLLAQKLPAAAERGVPDGDIERALRELTASLPGTSGTLVQASTFTVSQTTRVNGSIHVYLFNVKGIVAKRDLLPKPEEGAVIDFEEGAGSRVFALPFLGSVTEIKTERHGDKLRVQVPAFSRSMVIWCER
jgi:hypothetical protein